MASHPENDWNEWLAEHAGRFLLFARQQTRCAHDAEDVLQESLVESWKRANGRPDPALVFATIRRRAIDLGRATHRRARREGDGVAPELFSLPPEDAETTALLVNEVMALPDAQREVVTLKFWGGLTFAEIATTLDIPQGTAASRYRLALASLKQSISAFQ